MADPLTTAEVEALAAYNGEVARGIMHTPEWTARMAELQARFDAAAERYAGYHRDLQGRITQHFWR